MTQEQIKIKEYLVKTKHIIHRDDYDQGEQECVNGYITEGTYNEEDPKEAIKAHFEIIGLSLDIDSGEFDENSFHYSNLVDAENFEADEEDIERWKNGKKVLYTNTTITKVFEVKQVELK